MEEQVAAEGLGLEPLWRDFWRKAERVTVLTSIAFLVSTLANTLVFDVWGQTFLAIATPADVLMSGLQLAITPGLAAASFAGCYAWVISRRSKIRASAAYLIPFIVLALGISRLIGYGPHVAWMWWLVILLGWIFGGLVALANWDDRHGRATPATPSLWHRTVERLRRGGRYLAYAGLALTYMVFSGAMVWVISEAGYFSNGLRLSEKDTPASCSGRVVWTGERAILIDCGQFPAHNVQVLYGAESVRIIRDDRKWRNPSPPPLLLDLGRRLYDHPWVQRLAADDEQRSVKGSGR